MLKKINKVLVSVIILASLAIFIFSNGSKLIVPIAGYHSTKPPAQEQKYSPPTNETKPSNKYTPPPSGNGSVGAEQTVKKEVKKPVEVTEKDIHNELKHEIKGNSIKFKLNPKYQMKPIKPVIPKMGVGGKARLIRVLIP